VTDNHGSIHTSGSHCRKERNQDGGLSGKKLRACRQVTEVCPEKMEAMMKA
jgi:hypothetical protein